MVATPPSLNLIMNAARKHPDERTPREREAIDYYEYTKRMERKRRKRLMHETRPITLATRELIRIQQDKLRAAGLLKDPPPPTSGIAGDLHRHEIEDADEWGDDDGEGWDVD